MLKFRSPIDQVDAWVNLGGVVIQVVVELW